MPTIRVVGDNVIEFVDSNGDVAAREEYDEAASEVSFVDGDGNPMPVSLGDATADSVTTDEIDAGKLIAALDAQGYDITGVGNFESDSVNTDGINTAGGYEWQDFSASRSFLTWYQAPTDKDIQFSVSVESTADGTQMVVQPSVNTSQSANIITTIGLDNVAANRELTVGPIYVPAGNYYRLSTAGDTANHTIEGWEELR